MVHACPVLKCPNSSQKTELHKGLVAYKFPDDEELRQKWIKGINRDPATWKPNKSAMVCMLHFSSKCFVLPGNAFTKTGKYHSRPQLKNGAIPTIIKGWDVEEHLQRVKDQFELYCQQQEENDLKMLKNLKDNPLKNTVGKRGKAKEKVEEKKKINTYSRSKKKRKIEEVEEEEPSSPQNKDHIYWSTPKSSQVTLV